MTRGQLIGFWTIYIILLAVFGFHIDPGYELDLYRIYKEIDAFRAGQSSITDSSMIINEYCILDYSQKQMTMDGW